MAEYNTRYGQAQSGTRVQTHEMDEGLRSHMLRIYNYMAFGVGITGFVAYATYALATSNPAVAQALYGSPLKWVVMLAPLGMVFFLAARVNKMSFSAAQITFWLYAALMGVSLSSIFLIFTGQSITQVFFISAASFAGLSLYGYTTKKDLSGWGSFLIMGLIGIIIASVVNIFLASSALAFAVSAIGVLVFAGLTAYDTQRLKSDYVNYAMNSDGATVGKMAIMGALSLYLDFINLFIMMLQLFGSRE